MDMRGHGKSQGQCGLLQEVDCISDDTMLFHKRVIEQHYNKEKGFDKPPNAFIVAHSFGGLQTISALLRDCHLDENRQSRYAGVFFACPFFKMQEDMGGAMCFVNCLIKMKGDNAYMPEFSIDYKTMDPYYQHWFIDKRNRF
jgi:alpha-beta hydrolase superfamily lysophospholipase